MEDIKKDILHGKMSSLEKELNEKLFTRSASGIELTQDGKLLYEKLKQPVNTLRSIEKQRLRKDKKEQKKFIK